MGVAKLTVGEELARLREVLQRSASEFTQWVGVLGLELGK